VQPPREIVSRPVVSTRMPRERVQPWPDAAPRARTPAVPESRYVIPPTRRAEDARTLPRPARGTEAGPERVPPPRPPRYEEVRKSMPPPPAVIPREQAITRGQSTTREQSTGQREIRTVPRPAQPAVVAPPASRPAVPGSVQSPRARTESMPPPPVTMRGQTTPREQSTERREVGPVPRPPQPAVVAPPASRPAVPGSVQAPRARTEAAPQRGEAREGARERPLPGQPASQTYRGRDRESRDTR
jgi:hypothetical protein